MWRTELDYMYETCEEERGEKMVKNSKQQDFEQLSYGTASLNKEDICKDFWSQLRSKNAVEF